MANTPKTCCCVLCGCVCGGGGADENWKNQFYAGEALFFIFTFFSTLTVLPAHCSL